MKTRAIEYASPMLDVFEMVMEAPIAASLGAASTDGLDVSDATLDDWESL